MEDYGKMVGEHGGTRCKRGSRARSGAERRADGQNVSAVEGRQCEESGGVGWAESECGRGEGV